MIDIGLRLADVQCKIQALSSRNEKQSAPVKLVAVSKKQPLAAIEAAIDSGQRCFGESYVQEALPKIQALSSRELEWHFIGAIQSNKTRDIASHFSWVHTVDRLKIAQRLSDQRPAELPPLNVCLQVNIDADDNKAGVSPGQCVEYACKIAQLPNIRLRGLMTILKAAQAESQIRDSYRAMHVLFEETREAIALDSFDTLSMGMSGDWPLAIEQGATLVRIGTAIFGERSS